MGIKVKIFESSDRKQIEQDVNEFLSEQPHEDYLHIDIEYKPIPIHDENGDACIYYTCMINYLVEDSEVDFDEDEDESC